MSDTPVYQSMMEISRSVCFAIARRIAIFYKKKALHVVIPTETNIIWPHISTYFICWCELSLWRNFAIPKFRQNEISLQWMRNFAKITVKFRLTQRKFASALTKIRSEISPNFREQRTKNTKFLVHFFCTVLYGAVPIDHKSTKSK